MNAYELTEEDKQRVKILAAKLNDILAALKRVAPEMSGETLGTLAHNLADLWDIANQHQERVSAILNMKGPEDRRRLADLLSDLLYGDIDGELPYHIESIRQTVPKLIETLEQ